MGWNVDIPALGNQIAEDVPDIEENFQYLYDVHTVQEVWIPAGAWTARTTNGAAFGTKEYTSNDIMAEYYAFDTTTEEFVACNVVMPPNWNRGTVKAKFFWAPATDSGAAGDDVEWEIAGYALSDGDTIDTAAAGNQVITDKVIASESAILHVTAATPAVTIAGTPALGDMIQLVVSRNVGGTDNHGYDIWLFGVLIQYSVTNTVTAW